MDCEIEIIEVKIEKRKDYSSEWIVVKFRGKRDDFEWESQHDIMIDCLLSEDVEKEILTIVYKLFKNAYDTHIELEKKKQREEEVKAEAKALAGRKIEDIFKLIGELEE